jgi:hypothetical protein
LKLSEKSKEKIVFICNIFISLAGIYFLIMLFLPFTITILKSLGEYSIDFIKELLILGLATYFSFTFLLKEIKEKEIFKDFVYIGIYLIPSVGLMFLFKNFKNNEALWYIPLTVICFCIFLMCISVLKFKLIKESSTGIFRSLIYPLISFNFIDIKKKEQQEHILEEKKIICKKKRKNNFNYPKGYRKNK